MWVFLEFLLWSHEPVKRQMEAWMPLSPAVPQNPFFGKSEFSNTLISEDASGGDRIRLFEILSVACHRDMCHLLAEVMIFWEDSSNQN